MTLLSERSELTFWSLPDTVPVEAMIREAQWQEILPNIGYE